MLVLLAAGRVVQLDPRHVERVRATVDHIASVVLPSGNYPTRPESRADDRLVQWCHGAPGP
jgi:hypothetical protein